MVLELIEIDPSDDRQVEAYWAAGDEADRHERPYSIFWSLRAATVALRGDDPTYEIVPLAAIKDGECVGQCQIVMPQSDNRHLAYLGPLVRPAYRRRGIGSALLGAAIERVRAAGRSTVVADATWPAGEQPSWRHRFLVERGFRPGISDVHRILPLPVPDGRLRTWAAEAARFHQDYRLVTVRDGLPDDLVAGFCALQEAFNSEAPMGDMDLEPEVWTSERLRANEQRRAQQGTWTEATLALAPDGSVAGATDLEVTEEGSGHCLQGATLVLRGHRGHRLGMALKVANLRSLQDRGARVAMVHSWNAEQNDHMGAINATLGFVAVEQVAEMQRLL